MADSKRRPAVGRGLSGAISMLYVSFRSLLLVSLILAPVRAACRLPGDPGDLRDPDSRELP
jgi:hypothetical protein